MHSELFLRLFFLFYTNEKHQSNCHSQLCGLIDNWRALGVALWSLISQSGQLGLGNELGNGWCSRISPLLLLHLCAFPVQPRTQTVHSSWKKAVIATKKDTFRGCCWYNLECNKILNKNCRVGFLVGKVNVGWHYHQQENHREHSVMWIPPSCPKLSFEASWKKCCNILIKSIC